MIIDTLFVIFLPLALLAVLIITMSTLNLITSARRADHLLGAMCFIFLAGFVLVAGLKLALAIV